MYFLMLFVKIVSNDLEHNSQQNISLRVSLDHKLDLKPPLIYSQCPMK